MIKIYLCVQFLLFLGSLCLYWKLSSKKVGIDRKDRFDWMLKHKKWFGVAHAAAAIIISVPFIGPIKSTTWCWYKGYEHSVDTRRDLLSGRCSYKGAGGEWVPIERLIGVAESTDKPQENNTDHNTNTQQSVITGQ